MADFDIARAEFDRAASHKAGHVVRHLTLAGHPVRLEVAGQALFDRLFPPLSHVAHEGVGADAALRLRVWDAEATEVTAPDAASAEDPGMNGQVTVSDDRRYVRYRRRTSTSWLDREAGDLVACFRSAAGTSINDRGKPLQFPLAVWHLDRGCPMIHAGVVAKHGRGVLFPGKSGTGKTTAALSAAMAGYDYISDDCVGIERTSSGSLRAHSVFGSANIAPHHLARFPSLVPHAITDLHEDEEKYLLLLKSLLPRPLATTATIDALVVPAITQAGTTRLSPATRGEALRALAPSTLLFFPGWGAGQLNFLAELVASVSCYRLEMGPRLDDIPMQLDALLGA